MSDKNHAKTTIFVSIVSYRDSECQWTIESLFKQAAFPDRIFVGQCAQYDFENDSHCFVKETRSSQVRTVSLDYRSAKGPCLARALAQTLWEGEDYYLQIDSHMRFAKNWDSDLIIMLTSAAKNSINITGSMQPCTSTASAQNTNTPQASDGKTNQYNQKIIITTYPPNYSVGQKTPSIRQPVALCGSHFDKNGMLRIRGRKVARELKAPIPSLFCAAGFMFCSSRVILEVPYDASLKNLFFGEEMGMCARLWTNGWDFYTPCYNVIYHCWSRDHRPSFRKVLNSSSDQQLEQYAQRRVQALVGMNPLENIDKCKKNVSLIDIEKELKIQESVPLDTKGKDLFTYISQQSKNNQHQRPQLDTTIRGGLMWYNNFGRYGLGNVRSLSDFQRYVGVDFQQHIINEHCKNGGLNPSYFVKDPLPGLLQLLKGY